MSAFEVNFDGLIGPNHNYSGLAFGNLASSRNAQNTSSPKQAALQGLEKMRTLIRLGYKQGFMLPQQRPDTQILRALGFSGTDENVIAKASQSNPELISMVYSASSMWAANAATVTPSHDSTDGKVHFTPANLVTTSHRAIEHQQTQKLLSTIFNNNYYFTVHSALPSINRFADEGAANHTRLTSSYDDAGVGLFVYGRDENTSISDLIFPARQTLEASQAIARQHTLAPQHAIFLKQSARAINAGAFHNDVVAVGNGPVLFYHQDAYDAPSQMLAFDQLAKHFDFKAIEVPAEKVSLNDAITSYLFNSQLLASPTGDMNEMRLIAPTECYDNINVRQYLSELVEDQNQPIRHVEYVDVRQSMSNGGGPACLRLRVALTEEELAAVNPAFLLDEQKIDALKDCVNEYYRESLNPEDLLDPAFLIECQTALDALTKVIGIHNYYDFQTQK
ncbi:MAG: N-succinylarginine dihydrolase [Gammaproteobacteria bacterium]|nr:N-succinylarginine dihydrolase [Gammaproteobacteria bacterium]